MAEGTSGRSRKDEINSRRNEVDSRRGGGRSRLPLSRKGRASDAGRTAGKTSRRSEVTTAAETKEVPRPFGRRTRKRASERSEAERGSSIGWFTVEPVRK